MTNAKNTMKIAARNIVSRRGAGKFIYTGYRKYSSGRRFSTLSLLVVAILIILFGYLGNNFGKQATARIPAQVVNVADGDTIKVKYASGQQESIRLIGIDTPETHHPSKPVGCFGPEAENFTRNALDGKAITLEYDVEKHDKYGRTLAYVYLENSRFNDELLRQGFARVLNIEPNSKYARKYALLEIEAKKADVGLWGYCKNDN